MKVIKLASFSLIVALYACGGSNGENAPEDTTETGVFLDSPVINIGYRTETKEGLTNSLGEYEYLPGETVTFYIGDIEFPPVEAKGIITPQDMTQSNDLNDTIVINISRLLQSIDSSGNTTDGITIDAQAHSSALNLSIDFSIVSFDNDVSPLVSNSGSSNTTLIDSNTAISHLAYNSQCKGTIRQNLVGKRLQIGNGYINFKHDFTFIQDIGESGAALRTGTYSMNGLQVSFTYNPGAEDVPTDATLTFTSATPEAGDIFTFSFTENGQVVTNSNAPVSNITEVSNPSVFITRLVGKRLQIGNGYIDFKYNGSFSQDIGESGVALRTGTYSINGLQVNFTYNPGAEDVPTDATLTFISETPEAGDTFTFSFTENGQVDTNPNAPITSLELIGDICNI